MHYQQADTYQESREDEGKVTMTKYKSLESFPLDEILSELTRQHNKIKMKHSQSNFQSQLGSNERPPSSQGMSSGVSQKNLKQAFI